MDAEDVVERHNEPLPLPDGVKLVMQPTEADAQFLEWQTYLTRKICAIFGVAPSDLPPSQCSSRRSYAVMPDVDQEKTTG